MNRFVAMGGVVLVLVALASLADAQQQGRGRGFGGFGRTNLVTLASIEAVQTEIGANDNQKAEIAKIAEKLRGERPAGGARGRRGNLSDEERAKLRQQAEQRSKTAREELAKALKPQQVKRLEEISLQLQGSSALTNPEVVAKLKLSDEQVTKLRAVANESRQAMRTLFQGGNVENAREKLAELRKSSDEKSLAVLNADQQKQFTAMKGKPFELPQGAFGRRRGRRGNN
jgi:hypothetical protein